LGYNPIQQLLGATTLAHLPAATSQFLTGRSFFPGLIAAPFKKGLNLAFDFAIVSCLLAAGASALRGGKYVHGENAVADRVEAAGRLQDEVTGKGLVLPAGAGAAGRNGVGTVDDGGAAGLGGELGGAGVTPGNGGGDLGGGELGGGDDDLGGANGGDREGLRPSRRGRPAGQPA
jgi:hypothetical protein